MEKNQNLSTMNDPNQQNLTMQEFNPRGFTTPSQNPPQTSQEMKYQVDDVTNNPHELTTNELLQLQQDPKTHHLINTMMKFNPTQYMLALEK